MRATRRNPMLAIFLAVACARVSEAVITLNANFDSGSLCLVASSACDDGVGGGASSVSGNTVTLVGRDNFNNNEWKWIYFQASGVLNQQVNFQIGDDFDTGGSSLNNHRMVYSYDQVNWNFFDSNVHGAGQFAFHNNMAFTQDTVYVAYGQPYPYQRVVDQTAALVSNPWVSPTSSGDASLIVAQSQAATDDIGRTILSKNIYGYKITDASYSGPKQKIVLVSGVHANETLGNFTLEGLVNFLTGNELQAARLRRYAEFYVYPMANPDGRFAGYNRSTVQVPSVDPNRAWNPPNYVDPDNPSATILDISRLGEAIKIDTGQNVNYMIDFHSTVNPSIPYHHGLVLPQWQSDPFWLALRGLEPAIITGTGVLSDYTGAKFGKDVLGADFSTTFETVFPANEPTSRYLSLGRNFGLAWDSVFNLTGDLNFDGALNAQDWLLFIAGSETNMGGYSAIQKYEHGDLDGDGQNSFSDFDLFKERFELANGAGSFETMLASLPETSVFLLTTTAVVLAQIGTRRRQRASTQFDSAAYDRRIGR